MKCKIKSVNIGLDPIATVTLATEDKPQLRGIFDDFNDADIEVTIKKYRKKRSLDANAYAWTLISKIAFILGLSKEEAYQQIIRDYGLTYTKALTDDAAEFFCKFWSSKGIGWQAEIMNRNREDPRYVDVMFTVGSSAYDKAEFAKFLDAVITECKEMGIPYETGAEKALLESA